MARLNIEEKLWNDVRFKKLIKKLGEATAIGEWVLVAFEAQRHWAKGKQPIPDDDWAFGEYNEELINCRLVRKVEGGYHLCGSEEHFDWYLKMLEFSKKGVESRKLRKEILDEKDSTVNSTVDGTVDCAVNGTVDCAVNSTVDSAVNPLTLTLAPTLKNNIYMSHPFDDRVRELYNEKYPHKKGAVSKPIDVICKNILNENDFLSFVNAMDCFCIEYRTTEKRFIPQFKTFANNWRDWVNKVLEIEKTDQEQIEDQQKKNNEWFLQNGQISPETKAIDFFRDFNTTEGSWTKD